ncbi:serine/arginine repetitive matrix protein 1 [Nematolebias whitei]|uniref:serine/arginine repetitive matrix protein 1 n=1 Tax=Nematolebias whitei TaxID=451745 RepID=UPI001899648F|nr:serine/arginine repetitive matrix protein 1 [Nematolebias whitei]
MAEKKIPLVELKQEADVSNNEGTSVDVSVNTPVKRKRGRPKSSKKSNVCVTAIHPTALVSAKSNGESTPPPRGRGRPRLSDTKRTEQQEGGRQKASATVQKAAADNFLNGCSVKRKRGRPKGTIKRKLESLKSGKEEEGSSVTPRKRGRPKKSLGKEPKLEKAVNSERDGRLHERRNLVKRERGRPRKVQVKCTEEASSDVSVGRPQKEPDVPVTGKQRGRPRLQPAKRGRPRKYPLPSPDEPKKPKVWKPLGRPRKYPRAETPEKAAPAPRRSRGRPCKSESKKGAHLRRKAPSALSTPRAGPPQRKRGRPAATAKGESDVPRKRGRPKGSVNKNKARSETHLNSVRPNHSKAESELPAAGVEREAEAQLDTEMSPV